MHATSHQCAEGNHNNDYVSLLLYLGMHMRTRCSTRILCSYCLEAIVWDHFFCLQILHDSFGLPHAQLLHDSSSFPHAQLLHDSSSLPHDSYCMIPPVSHMHSYCMIPPVSHVTATVLFLQFPTCAATA